MSLKIAIDGMGGDHAPSLILEGLVLALQRNPSLHFYVFGQKEVLEPLLRERPSLQDAVTLCDAPDVITAETKPSQAVRGFKRSSMRLALEAVKEGTAQGVVSAGNTGAYMALAKLILKTLPGINRPAIITQIPTKRGESVFLDLGGNVDCEARDLAEFALMGEMFARHVLHTPRPKVGLLNIGSESLKGPETLRQTAQILKTLPLDFQGFVEGNDITSGVVDVVVTDGFTGNVALKTIEGTVGLLMHVLKQGFANSLWGKLAFVVSRPILRHLKFQLDPRKYNGAFWLGLNGVAVKSHGGADALAFAYAIETVVDILNSNLNSKIIKEIQNPVIQDKLRELSGKQTNLEGDSPREPSL